VGTNHDYVKLFDAAVDEGELWKNNLDAVVGSNVAQSLGLKVGDTFFGAHGLSVADMEHEEMSYRIVGILEENNSVIDKLILTNIESVWAVHDHDEEHHEEHSEPQLGSAYETGFPEGDEDAEITSMLIKFRSPMGAVTLPRMINADTNMQAASPAFETQRLFSLLGIGVDLLKAFAAIIIIIAGLSIFISLYNALKDRKYDLAIMRSLGASKTKLFFHVVLEGVIITVLGGLLGFLIGHGLTEFLAGLYEKSDEIGLTGLIFVKQELAVMLISVGIGIIASLIPAINAYKTDISEVLAKE
ncbi:MAG: ABC transporter permease, partial [Roseivirga sp.]|nr:ABC transporter permease [Roseivirga sp.]